MSRGRCQRIVLVGFMGSGKTSVGRALADRLGWRFVDFDDEIVQEAGASIPEIFERRGEAHFRELEARVAERLLSERAVVLGSGGGWAAAPGRLAEAPPETVSVWLRVSPETAVRRVAVEGSTRPLLAGADPLREAERLLEERTPFYRRADWTVDTEDSSVEDVSSRILEFLEREHPEASIECPNDI